MASGPVPSGRRPMPPGPAPASLRPNHRVRPRWRGLARGRAVGRGALWRAPPRPRPATGAARGLRPLSSGLSLVELLIGLVLSAVVVLAAMALWSSTRRSTDTLVGITTLQGQAHQALGVMTQQLQQAGAVELRASQEGASPALQSVVLSEAWEGLDVQGDGLRDGVAVWGEEGGRRPDSFTVSQEHRSAGTTPDCLGAATVAGLGRVDSRFWVSAGILRCQGSGNASGQPLSNQVEDFQVQYWAREGRGAAQRHQLLRADQLQGRWSQVVAVVLCLQLVSDARASDAALAWSGAALDASAGHRDCQGMAWPRDGCLRVTQRRTVFLHGLGRLL